jgi:hypothetical protein
MKLLHAILPALLAASPVLAAEPVPPAADVARQTMREAMLRQAAMPVRPAVMPSMRPEGGMPPPVRPPVTPDKAKGDAVRQKALGAGMRDADAVRAEMANRAAHGGAAGMMRQNSGDMMGAPMMQRSQGMDPGGGMMPGGGGMMGGTGAGGGSGGGGGMMPGGTSGGGGSGGGGMMPGGAGSGTLQPSTGGR